MPRNLNAHLELHDDAAGERSLLPPPSARPRETSGDAPTPPTSRATTTSPSRDVRIHTFHQVAGMLGVAGADVLDLIRRGALRAKRVASSVVVSGDALADFMATPDAAARFPRFTEAQPVAVVDEDGTLAFGVFVVETDDGRVVVSRAGFLGRYYVTGWRTPSGRRSSRTRSSAFPSRRSPWPTRIGSAGRSSSPTSRQAT